MTSGSRLGAVLCGEGFTITIYNSFPISKRCHELAQTSMPLGTIWQICNQSEQQKCDMALTEASKLGQFLVRFQVFLPILHMHCSVVHYKEGKTGSYFNYLSIF